MRRLLLSLLALAAGCTNEHALELAITASAPVPDEVVAWELRIANVEDGSGCPTVEQSAGAVRVGRLAHAQTFTDVGMSVGEIPAGSWTFAVIGRDATCTPRFYGCTPVTIGDTTFSPIAIRVDPVDGVTALCGSCRSCDAAGGCSVVAASCD